MERCILDNRSFLLGLDELYRYAMATHESKELLPCARRVAEALGVAPSSTPIEGYYTDDVLLAEYFRLMRALQEVPKHRRPEVSALPEFERLYEVLSAPLFGVPQSDKTLLPTGRDPLSAAMLKTVPHWTVPTLLDETFAVTQATDDCSLVGLAGLARDPVVLTALRESVVLYAELMATGLPPSREVVWQVDPALAARANRFIAAFNTLFDEDLPQAHPAKALIYWYAFEGASILGRCVRLGQDESNPPQFYHWAIYRGPEAQLAVHEFWSPEIWTTDRYRASLAEDGRRR